MKFTTYIVIAVSLISIAAGQSMTPINQPDKRFPTISEAFQGKTLVQRSVDYSGLANYLIRFHHDDVVKQGPYLTEVVLSVSNGKGKILSQSVLDISGVTTSPPDKLEFRMIRFSVHESLEASSVLSIGIHTGFRVTFSPYLLISPKTKIQNKTLHPTTDTF